MYGKYTPEQRLSVFLSKIDNTSTPDGCWNWTGGCQGDGYGTMGWGERGVLLTHRIAYELANGPIETGLCVCHSCDNPPCCNPSHLFLGTHKENMLDRERKGRTLKGERMARCKLTDEQVLEIRRLYALTGLNQTEIAKRFGVDASTVHVIVRYKSRK